MKAQIYTFRSAQPFVPFEVELVGGRVLSVPHPEFVYVPPGKAPFIVITHEDGVPETLNAFMILAVRPSKRKPMRRRKAG